MKSDQGDNYLSNYSDTDIAYMQSLSAAVVQRSPKYLLLMVSLMVVVVMTAIAWMGWAEIDVVVRGSGKVIPARQVQKIQSLEGGIVSEILVREGDQVEVRQPLMKISDIAFSGSYEENRLLYFELKAKSIRLRAEAYAEEFVKNDEVAKASPELLKSEESLFDSNRQQLKETLVFMKNKLANNKAA